LRELWNTRNTLNFDLPWGELDGCRFGLKALLDLLEQPGCEIFSRLTSEEISQRIHKAIISTDASKQMAEFVRWATDCYMEFLASRKLHNAIAVTNGLSKLEHVKSRLLVNTFEVDRYVQLNNVHRDINVRNARMLGILDLLFNAIIDHHKRVDKSLVGVEEVLLVAEEPDFVNRRVNNYMSLQSTFASSEMYGLPMHLRLVGVTLAIQHQIKQRGHQMPLEYAIKTVAPVIPRLDHALLKLLPVPDWLAWLKEVGLQEIGERLVSVVNAQITVQPTQAPIDASTIPSVYTTARTHQVSSVTSISSNAIMEELQNAFNEDRSPGSHHDSLFGSRHQTPQNALAPPPKDTAKPHFKLALPPTPLDQKRAREGTVAPQATDAQASKQPRTLPASEVPHTSTLSEVGWRESNSRKDFADDLRIPLQRAREPLDFSVSRVTPNVTDNGSEYTSGSMPAARHGVGRSTVYFGADFNLKYEKPNYDMAGSNERAAETIEKLKQARPMRKSGKRLSMLSPMGRIEEEPAQRSSAGDRSEIDDD
jgi:hypothetical protein